MSRYRKFSVRLYGDQRFCALSPLVPSGQQLFIYLLTGPHTTILPGLFEAGLWSIAEKLRWSREDTERCFQELIDQEMVQFDHDALVMWIPGLVVENLPPNQNVLTSWRRTWEEIPSSLLKYNFLEEVKIVINQSDGPMKRNLYEAFPELLRLENQPLSQPLMKRLPKPLSERLANTVTGAGAGTGLKEKKEKEKKEKRIVLKEKVETFDDLC